VAGLATAAAAAGGAPAAAAGMILNRVDDIMPGTRTPESEAAAEPAVLIGDLAAAHDLATSRAAAGASSFRQRVGDKMVDVMSTQPGTMLVRMTSSGHTAHPPSPHASRRSLGSMHHTASFGAGITPTADADAVAALEEMQKLPLPRAQADTVDEGAAAPAPSREQLSEAVGDDAEQLAGKKERDLAGAADNGGEIQPEGTGTGRPPAQGAPRVVADETRQRFLIPDDGESLTDATSAMSKGGCNGAFLYFATRDAHLRPVPSCLQTAILFTLTLHCLPSAEVIERRKTPPVTKGQRLFEFAVDVTAAPPDSIYRHTKLVTLKPKYIIENQTSIPVDVKQLNASEPGGNGNPSPSTRFARTLAPGQRAAVYWDDSELSKELVVRPRVPGEVPDAWHWSGGFPIPDTEWYFGLRIRHRQGPRRYLNIPVNVTVGSSGSVQVTLKSPASVPPYRIENMCKDVQLYMVQASPVQIATHHPFQPSLAVHSRLTILHKLLVVHR